MGGKEEATRSRKTLAWTLISPGGDRAAGKPSPVLGSESAVTGSWRWDLGMGRDLRILAEPGKDWIPGAHPSPRSLHCFRAQGGNRSSPAPGSGKGRTRKD